MVLAANGIARILKTEGIEWVSTFPVCCVNNALGQEGIPMIMMRDERYAVAVADAFSRITGGERIGVCTVMGGINPAGLQIAYGALAQAYEDSSPVLCIAGGVSTAQTNTMRFDMRSAFQSVCKWVGHIDRPERVPEIMRRAFTMLRSGRPGPVLVTVPRGMGEYDEDADPYVPVKGWRPAPDPADVKATAQALLDAERPLIYAGEGVHYAGASEELAELAELLEIPVLTTLKAKSVFPENHPLSVGTRGEMANHFLRECDVLLAVGTSLSRGHFRHDVPDAQHKTVIQCTIDETDVNRIVPVDHALIGDARLALQALSAQLATQSVASRDAQRAALRADIDRARLAFQAKYGPLMQSDETPINPYRVYGDLMEGLDRYNSFVTHDSGNTRDQSSTVYEALIPRGYLGWGNVSTLGYGLAAAVAAKLAFPERQCVNITGDAGVGYMLGNLEALVRHEIGVTTIHVNNGGFAGYGEGFWGQGHDPYTCQVCEHDVADMSRAAAAIGYYAEDVTEPDQILPALARCLEQNEQGRPAYLEIICCQYPVFGAWVKA